MIDALVEKSIRVLLQSNEPVTSKIISNEIGMSVSSIKHNMDYIKQVVKESGCSIQSAPGKGIWIEADEENRARLEKIINENRDKSYYYSYRKSYILSILFHNNSNYTIQIFADDLGVGKNIINRDLDDIEKWLGYFDLRLERTRNKGISIVGGEFDKRQAIIMNNTSRMDEIEIGNDKPDDIDYRISQKFYSYFKQFYPKYNIFELQEYLCEVEESLELIFDDISFEQLLEYIAVSFDRVSGGNIILEANVLNHCKVTQKQYEVAKDLIDAVSRNVLGYMSIEARCLAAEFAMYSSYGVSNTSVIKEAYYNDIARLFVKNMKKMILNKNLLINENLIEDLGLFLRKKKMSKTYQSVGSQMFKDDIKDSLPSLYALVLTNVGPLEDKTKITFTENDIAYITMLLDNAIEDIKTEISILLYTSFDYNTGKYLENKIKRQVEGIYKIKAIRKDDINKTNINKYDIVLTTSPCPIDGAIKISRKVNDKDIKLIRKIVDKYLKKQQELETYSEHMFSEDLMLLNQKFKTKKEVIENGYKIFKADCQGIAHFRSVQHPIPGS